MQTPKFTSMQFVDADFKYIPGTNTFRIGDKYKDLVVGQELDALDGNNNVMGKLRVAGFYQGGISACLDKFADNNHGIHQIIDQGPYPGRNERRRLLRETLANIYANEPVMTDDYVHCVVIEFMSEGENQLYTDAQRNAGK